MQVAGSGAFKSLVAETSEAYFPTVIPEWAQSSDDFKILLDIPHK